MWKSFITLSTELGKLRCF